MSQEPNWTIDIKSLSHRQIVDLIERFKGIGHAGEVFNLRCELVNRLRAKGQGDPEIIRRMTLGVFRGPKLHELAETWAGIFRINIKEFKRIANAK